MSEAVEARRRELGLSPGQFATATGLTRQGAGHIRKGERRAYQDDTINGVATALQWKRDWYERLLRGEAPEVDGQQVDGSDPVRAELDALRDRLNDLERVLRDYLDDDPRGSQ